MRVPTIRAASAALACGNALPFLFPRLEILYLSSTLTGTAFMLVHIAMNSVIGAHGSAERVFSQFYHRRRAAPKSFVQQRRQFRGARARPVRQRHPSPGASQGRRTAE